MRNFLLGALFAVIAVTSLAIVGSPRVASAYTALRSSITETGLNQGDLVKYLGNVRDAVNEMITDHATNRTTLVETKTAVDELIVDHDADNAVVADLKAAVNLLRYKAVNYLVQGTSPVFAIDTNFDVKNTETTIFVANSVVFTLGDNTSCDTGTSKTLTSSQWGAAMLESVNATTCTLTWASGGYASEALALAAAKALVPAAGAVAGYVTVLAHASGFTAGTDALTTGAGGNVATTTNYYSLAVQSIAAVSSSPAAALTATAPTAPAAALTNSTALSLTP